MGRGLHQDYAGGLKGKQKALIKGQNEINTCCIESYLIAIEGHPGCCWSLDGPGQSQERIVGPNQSQKGIVGPSQSQVPPPLVSNSTHAGQRFHIVLLFPFDVKTHFLSQLTAEQIVSHKIRAHQLVLLLKRRKKYRYINAKSWCTVIGNSVINAQVPVPLNSTHTHKNGGIKKGTGNFLKICHWHATFRRVAWRKGDRDRQITKSSLLRLQTEGNK